MPALEFAVGVEVAQPCAHIHRSQEAPVKAISVGGHAQNRQHVGVNLRLVLGRLVGLKWIAWEHRRRNLERRTLRVRGLHFRRWHYRSRVLFAV